VTAIQPDPKFSLFDRLKQALSLTSPVLITYITNTILTAAASMAAPPTDSTIFVSPSEEEQAAQGEETLANINSGVGMSDASYGTDSARTTSISLASSAREYPFENGRRYHRFHERSYYFPNDDSEQDREDLTHALMTTLHL